MTSIFQCPSLVCPPTSIRQLSRLFPSASFYPLHISFSFLLLVQKICFYFRQISHFSIFQSCFPRAFFYCLFTIPAFESRFHFHAPFLPSPFLFTTAFHLQLSRSIFQLQFCDSHFPFPLLLSNSLSSSQYASSELFT